MKNLFSGKIKSFLILLFCFIVYSAAAFDMINIPIDDVYISLRYVWNFTYGSGLTFNPGEFVEGYSNPTWVLFVSLFAKILGIGTKYNLILLNRILSFLILFSAYIFFYRSFRIYVKNVSDSFLFLLALCSHYLLCSYAFTGMETPMVLFFLAGFFCYFNLYFTGKKKYALIASQIFLGLLAVSRPEGIIYIAAFILFIFILLYRYEKRTVFESVKKSFSYSYLSIAIFILFIVFRLYYYGELMPNTAAAKNYFSAETFLRGAHYILAGIFLGSGGLLSVLIFRFDKDAVLRFRHIFMYVFITVLAQFSFILYTGWDWMVSFRFMLPLVPLLLFVIFLNLSMQKKYLALILLFVLVSQSYYQRYYLRLNYQILSGYSGIRLIPEGYKDVGEFLNKIKNENDLMLIQEGGYVPYATDIRTFDLCGLTDKHIASIHGPHFRVLDLEYVLSFKKPTIIVTFKTLYDEKSGSYYSDDYYQSNAVMQSDLFKEKYKNVYYKYGIGVFVLKDRKIE